VAILPVNLLAPQPVRINWSSLHDISGYAIHNLSAQTVRAAYNWWGSAIGPTADDNPGGTGRALNGLVDHRPYLTSPYGGYIFMPLVIR
jgi:hypothetical protein